MLGCGYSNTIALPVLAAAALSTSYTCSAPHIKFLKLTTRQRRVHCWGGAQRNPRNTPVENVRSPRSGRQSNHHDCRFVIAPAIGRSAGSAFFWVDDPGVPLR